MLCSLHWQLRKQNMNERYDSKCKLLQSWFRTAGHSQAEFNKTNKTVKYFGLMNSNYGSNSNDVECEEWISKAEFKKLQLRMGIIIHCKGSKILFYISVSKLSIYFNSFLEIVTLFYSTDKRSRKFISIIFLETKAFKEIFFFYEGDSTSA